jgi:hypothetical protein
MRSVPQRNAQVTPTAAHRRCAAAFVLDPDGNAIDAVVRERA